MHTRDDIEERIARHTARVQRTLRILRETAAIRCWGCRATLPSGSRLDQHGWHSRPFEDAVFGTNSNGHMKEVSCPKCMKAWGWGDLL